MSEKAISLKDIQDIVGTHIAQCENGKANIQAEDLSRIDRFLKQLSEFSNIADYVEDTFKPGVSDQVKAINIRTEKATDSFLTECEKISALIPDASDQLKDALQASVNNMFSASSFQDLVSQHAKEIELLAKGLHSDLNDLKLFLQGSAPPSGEMSVRSRELNKQKNDHLLNGPIIPESS